MEQLVFFSNRRSMFLENHIVDIKAQKHIETELFELLLRRSIDHFLKEPEEYIKKIHKNINPFRFPNQQWFFEIDDCSQQNTEKILNKYVNLFNSNSSYMKWNYTRAVRDVVKKICESSSESDTNDLEDVKEFLTRNYNTKKFEKVLFRSGIVSRIISFELIQVQDFYQGRKKVSIEEIRAKFDVSDFEIKYIEFINT